MNSAVDDGIATARFPDSEIPGSKPTCRLPKAYRRQATSFFASQRQGIHRAPLLAWLPPTRLRSVVPIARQRRLPLACYHFVQRPVESRWNWIFLTAFCKAIRAVILFRIFRNDFLFGCFNELLAL